ncbi:hypothetical protein ASE36_13510 [Rhizobium sp. Root274]|uniref:hypothetical protein n=1 Tax=unclassified Rhizobium TaxID=2613769 RepID=UPI000715B880|nr:MULTISPECIES: hypothetical protein [unclassified Rhizobium]KQW29440.1 hypothetical protein ASC71_13535 [Rhizobium sp. Root1240]KRD29631.1 hypothetical protein ASE36_13510 [Rhizobium sp. Root274]
MVWVAAALALVAILLLRNRLVAMGLAVLIAIALGIIWFFTEENSERERNEAAAISVQALADPKTCVDPALPVAVTFTNKADKAITRLSFDLIGMPRGQTTIAYRGYLRDDQIVPSGQTVTRCYALLFHGFAHPRPAIIDATKYDWNARISLLEFGNGPAS